ncbi:hypothetical protein FA13DRAFT_1721129 [Coprinellus micaceus]|uniref:Uncharacterized protein n=1 Tax=Coprinellus micaceus TaxID=71717 RepID=A0A4Y7S3C8_COPMI|nr:hypothetical protein FA13DRAFT_1721129 [Coprinellus micaceus]
MVRPNWDEVAQSGEDGKTRLALCIAEMKTSWSLISNPFAPSSRLLPALEFTVSENPEGANCYVVMNSNAASPQDASVGLDLSVEPLVETTSPYISQILPTFIDEVDFSELTHIAINDTKSSGWDEGPWRSLCTRAYPPSALQGNSSDKITRTLGRRLLRSFSTDKSRSSAGRVKRPQIEFLSEYQIRPPRTGAPGACCTEESIASVNRAPPCKELPTYNAQGSFKRHFGSFRQFTSIEPDYSSRPKDAGLLWLSAVASLPFNYQALGHGWMFKLARRTVFIAPLHEMRHISQLEIQECLNFGQGRVSVPESQFSLGVCWDGLERYTDIEVRNSEDGVEQYMDRSLLAVRKAAMVTTLTRK